MCTLPRTTAMNCDNYRRNAHGEQAYIGENPCCAFNLLHSFSFQRSDDLILVVFIDEWRIVGCWSVLYFVSSSSHGSLSTFAANNNRPGSILLFRGMLQYSLYSKNIAAPARGAKTTSHSLIFIRRRYIESSFSYHFARVCNRAKQALSSLAAAPLLYG